MHYKVEYAIGYDHGGWESYWVDVDIPPEHFDESHHEWESNLKEAAGESLLESLGPNPHEVFAVVLSYFQEEEHATQ